MVIGAEEELYGKAIQSIRAFRHRQSHQNRPGTGTERGHPKRPEDILLFTGGHHTGHFYAIGEVLFSKQNPGMPVEWLPRPVLYVEEQYPWENGMSTAEDRTAFDERPVPVSYWRDTVFFTGMTLHGGRWWMYYGGSEYYTCLATADYFPEK